MAQDKNFIVELVFSYMKSTTYQKFVTYDRVPLKYQHAYNFIWTREELITHLNLHSYMNRTNKVDQNQNLTQDL